MPLFEILRKTTARSPDKEAVICGNDRHTYSQLKERVDKLASCFLSLGVQKDDRIAILLRNCHRYLETYFAAAKIGAVLVPINHRLAGNDIVYILNDSRARLLIAQPDFLSRLEGKTHGLPALENILSTDSPGSPEWRECPVYDDLIEGAGSGKEPPGEFSSSQMAQIYYTSGTTGRPKGVVLTHKNNSAHADGAIRELKLTQSDRWLHVSPMFHLADAWAVWALTKVGAAHVIVPGFEEHAVLETIQKHKVTLSNFIPTMLNLLVNFPEVQEFDCSSLRLIMSGGAPIAREVVKKILAIFGCDYIQTYGLTETSPFLTMSILKKEMESWSYKDKLRIMTTTGRPFDKIRLKVIKKNGDEVLRNAEDVGEIIAKGDTITPGYWGLPEETTERIVGGWLYTRDLAVVDPDGYVTIVDRMDDVIITGGENVYSVEVEDVLYACPGVLEAAAVGLPDPVWGEMVTAVVVTKKGEGCKSRDILRFCRERLAPFKTPKKVIFADELPKTGSAKICKYKLREKFGTEQKKVRING